MKTKQFINILLKGASQVMLQNNAITGLLFFIGIFFNSRIMGIGALLGVLVGTLTALLYKFNQKDITDGLYGFNGVLVGIALLFFFESSFIIFLLIVFGSVVSTLVMNFMLKKNLAPYTFPFVATTWVLLLLIKFANLGVSQTFAAANNLNLNILSSISMGFGQVMFQASIVTGILFFVAILINSRIGAWYALFGSVAGLFLGLMFSLPLSTINLGILGYNGILCGITFAGKKFSAFIYALLAILLSIIILLIFDRLGLIALTAPFVFAVWITLGIKRNRVAEIVK